jgi:nitroimidazol reductase NimA-like FMN-containing flavoprotein (pyridoxamine 5'-phosphate oxidase superfamily)
MSTTMTPAEREAFLAGLHVGVISLVDAGRGPLTVPIWYAYETARHARAGCSRPERGSASARRPRRRRTST